MDPWPYRVIGPLQSQSPQPKVSPLTWPIITSRIMKERQRTPTEPCLPSLFLSQAAIIFDTYRLPVFLHLPLALPRLPQAFHAIGPDSSQFTL